ncbi:aspartyl protease family protein [Winogradskyella sp. 3972H.M.0a.05]|uniref:aspartyl protease family protein n=1 Tax=Winogradskyella sp. 3972H.M.0a.05 TaxID=2950277 RepID=UPI003397E6F0
MIIPVELNGLELSFILDSGVSRPILFNFVNTDSLQIKDVERMYLRGLGAGGMIEALKSKNNFVKVGDAINVNQDIFVVFDSSINFTPRLGVPIHGIIGYDIFKDFVVEVNYSSRYIKLYKPENHEYKECKKCRTFPLTINNNKPFIEGRVKIDDQGTVMPVKLLIDTGGSDALWLFEDKERNIMPPEGMYFEDFLGKGLSGDVHGRRSKINSFYIGEFRLKDVNVAFPDSTSISYAKRFKERNGSISGEILKRFNIIFDYPNNKITLKKNSKFKAPFYYNKSGIVLEQIGFRVVREKSTQNTVDNYGRSNEDNITINLIDTYRYALKPAFTIVELRDNSPGKECGLLVDDIIISINGNETQGMTLEDVNGYLSNRTGKLVKIKVDRDGRLMTFKFKLRDVFQRKNPQ